MSLLYINGETVNFAQEQFLSFHGNSVFTTFHSSQLHSPLGEKHWQRLASHAAFFDYHLPNRKLLFDKIEDILNTCKVPQKIRIILSKENFALCFDDFVKPDSEIYKGVKLIKSDYQVHPQLASFKTGNYLPYELAHKQALKACAFEAYLTDQHGHLVDCSRSSPMVFNEEGLISLQGGLLGTMREEILDFAKKQGLFTSEQSLLPHKIKGQILIANSLFGLVPVGKPQCAIVEQLIEEFRMDF